jgi:hypothetical protein
MMSRQLGVRQVLMQWGLGTICAVAAIVAGTAVAADAPRASAIRFELPPLLQPATGEHHPDDRGHPDGRPSHSPAYHPAPADRPMPSIPSSPRGHSGGGGRGNRDGH